MNAYLIIAILSPFVWGLMNVFDKWVLSHKVKRAFSFSIIVGITNIIFGAILLLFLDWTNVNSYMILFPVIGGFILGLQLYFYYYTMNKSDVSYLVGFVYLYPILVSILSFLFLNEKLSFMAYVGMLITILGVILLSFHSIKAKLSFTIITVLPLILFSAGYEFFIKVSTNNLPLLHGIGINMVVMGITILPALLLRKNRIGVKKELKNIKWSFMIEIITFASIYTTYLAMDGLPATVVSSIGALQPMAVIIFERIAHSYFGKITKDTRLLPKLGAIAIIVLGVTILSIFGT